MPLGERHIQFPQTDIFKRIFANNFNQANNRNQSQEKLA